MVNCELPQTMNTTVAFLLVCFSHMYAAAVPVRSFVLRKHASHRARRILENFEVSEEKSTICADSWGYLMAFWCPKGTKMHRERRVEKKKEGEG